MDYLVRFLLSSVLLFIAYRWVVYIKDTYKYTGVVRIVKGLCKFSDSRLVGVCLVASLFACIGISGLIFVLYQMVYV